MAILGYNTKGGNASGFAAGRMYVSKFTLASAQTMSELHGWFNGGGTSTETVRLVIYSDSAGSPNTRLAFTNLIAVPNADTDLNQTGFSVALAAGDYWIGFSCVSVPFGNALCYMDTVGTWKGKSGGGADPPNNPFGSFDVSGARQHSCWAVVNPSFTTWNGSSTVSLTDTITTAGTVITHATAHGASAVAETVTVTTAGHKVLPQLILAPRSPDSLTLVLRSPGSLVLTPR